MTTLTTFEAGLEHIQASPADDGRIEMIACRPAVDERRLLDEGRLDLVRGLEGDTWLDRGNEKTPDKKAHPLAQLTLMNSRVIDLLTGGDRDRWALAGDQLFVDLDLSLENLPHGTQLFVGDGGAVIEVTEKPHRGCYKFADRFGADALRFVNSGIGPELNLRGVNARVIEPGVVKLGDSLTKRRPTPSAV